MIWYEDRQSHAHVARYENTFRAWCEERAAAAQGWRTVAITKGPPRVAVGRTIRNALLTGGITLLLGKREHKSGIVTVAYVRGGLERQGSP